uniref:Glycoprotein n=1 Tax=Strongyloides papillosus TaxID=174720 RepID=A0A0N5BA84_STREA
MCLLPLTLLSTCFTLTWSFQLCQVYLGGGKQISLDICKNLDSGDIYSKESVTFIKANFIDDYCQNFTEDVYISESRLLRIKVRKMYLFGNGPAKPSCVPDGAVYLINGLYYLPSKKHNYITNISNAAGSKLAHSICKEYTNFINAKDFRAVSETRDFIRQIYGSDNITGYIVGGKIYIQPCVETPATSVISSKKLNGICYKETPIVIHGSTLMFSSIGIDLESEATTVDCDSIEKNRSGVWENNISLKRIILALSSILILMLILNCILISWCTSKGQEKKAAEIDYNDFLYNLANETIGDQTLKRCSAYSLTAVKVEGTNEKENFKTSNRNTYNSGPIVFTEPAPQPHPFDAFLQCGNETLPSSVHV